MEAGREAVLVGKLVNSVPWLIYAYMYAVVAITLVGLLRFVREYSHRCS